MLRSSWTPYDAINGAVEAIYLHHNRLRSTWPLAAFFKNHANVLREVHRSHNELCPRVETQLQALAKLSTEQPYIV